MTTVLLVRHGLTAVTGKILLGWTPGVGLDDRGAAQASAVGTRLSGVPLSAIVSSPLDRCRQTADAIATRRPDTPATPGGRQDVTVDERFGEVHYGDWTGKELAVLAKEPLWKVVQSHPSAVVFPGPDGEALRDTQARGVAAVRAWNERLGPDATWLLCSHGDVIRTIVADALGLHLDLYHRITIDPCSLTVIRYGERLPLVRRLNDVGGDVTELLPPPPGAAQGGSAQDGSAQGGGAAQGVAPGTSAASGGEDVPASSGGAGGQPVDREQDDPDTVVGGGAGAWVPPSA
ncbi:MSMEG_4193 family putative phosphomutase [Frankia sp. R82]|uniref:MSMEG_4193 family putative phosphomutase n=1 Tax=Frankia sp. R82 TaxID=2950553 RepID=UPI002043C509|nr:MSMEG_4193 family putative phosphomutase [Frankia sp. R82]MCM3885117.1 MSMEG_4193 family putative phosphomutase [Frankia sp. R82]